MFLVSINSSFAQVYLFDANENEIPILPDFQQFLSQNEDTLNLVAEWYAKQGFLNVRVNRLAEEQFQVDKGCLFFMSLNAFDDHRSIVYTDSSAYSEIHLKEILSELLLSNINSGAYFTEIEIARFEPNIETCIVEIELNILSGDLTYLTEIAFSGNRLNQTNYLRKRSYFSDSLIASKVNLDFLTTNLYQTELFESINVPQILFKKGAPIISFEVQEKSLNQFDGLLGYVPDANGNGQIVGDLSLNLWSVIADGNGVQLDYRKLEPEVSRLNLGISQHWFGNVPLGLTTGFNFFQNDTTYQSREISVDAYFELGNGVDLIANVGLISITGTEASFTTIEPGGKKQQASFGFRYSSLFGSEVPRRGYKTEIQFGVANKSTEFDSLKSIAQQFILANAEYYIPIGKQSVIASGLHSYLLISDNFTDIDLKRFGGAKSIRGFSEEQFQASQLIWGDVEYRFLTNPSSYLFAFGAAGWFHRPQLLTETNQQFKNTKFIESVGFGLSYKTRVGRLKFTYALSPSEALGNGKVHIGIKTKL